MKTTSYRLLIVALVAGFLLASQLASAQTPASKGWITLYVPPDARVFFNDIATTSRGYHRRFFRDGMQPGKSYRYDVRIVGQFLGKPWVREETVFLKAGETKQLVFRYTDPPRIVVNRPVTPGSSENRRQPPDKPVSPVKSVSADKPVLPDSSSWLLPLPPIRTVSEAAAFSVVSLKDLKITGGTLAPADVEAVAQRRSAQDLPYVWATVDGGDEAYLDLAAANGPVLALHTSRSRTAVGKLSLPPDSSGQPVHLSYTAPVTDSSYQARRRFYEVKRSYYQQLLKKNAAGSAWFRHQLRDAVTHLTFVPAKDPVLSSTPSQMAHTDLMKWYAIFAGGRAIAENLALEPYRSVASGRDSVVPLSTVAGVTVPAINWKDLAPKVQPALDPLASLIPADQHAIFFPSAQQAIQLARHAADRETVFLGLADARAEHNRIQARYERQFAISLDELASILDSEQVQQVAITGSDPHVVMGTDVAILMESTEPNALADRLIKQITENVQSVSDVKKHTPNSLAMTVTGLRNADRTISTYVAVLPQAIVLTNSMVQLQRLTAVMTDGEPSLATLPEFAFFRDRYRFDDPAESALVVISDATIRRWCGPRWRIGQARRLHNAAVLAEWQAACMGRQMPTVEPLRAQSSDLVDDVIVKNGQVYSETYGCLSFMTPVAELPMKWVTIAEKKAYEAWRADYQRNWIRFDPIAIRLSLDGDHRLAVDLTVMPLRIRTDYRRIRSLTQGAKLSADAGDPHDSLAELAMAFNTKSEWFYMARMIATPYFNRNGQSAQTDPLAWFEGTLTLYADDDPAWKELIQRLHHNRDNPDLVAAIVTQLPIGIQAEVTNGLELTKFMIALRAIVESTTPGMLKWEPREHRGKPYTKVSTEEILRNRHNPTSDETMQEVEAPAIYYATFGDALIIAFRESVLQRALDRRAVGHAPTDGVTKVDRVRSGDNVSLRVDARLIELVGDLVHEEYQPWMQSRAWSNLPILNEWKRRYPNDEPLAVHERLWNVQLICPGGGDYRWNETWQTMESTVYGHPAAAKKGPVLPPFLNRISTGDAGLTFDRNGLRARLILQMKDAGVIDSH